MQFLRRALGERWSPAAISRRCRPAGRPARDLAGLVCRQQPLMARGIIFLLLEDEFGMVNVLVSRGWSRRTETFVRSVCGLIRTTAVLIR